MVGDNFCKQKPRGKISKVRRKSGFSIFALSTRMYSDCRRMRWDCQFLRMLRSTTNSQSWLDKTCCYARCTDPNFMRNVSLDSWWNRDSSKYSYSYREQQLQMWQYGKLGTTKAHHQPQNTTEVPSIGRDTSIQAPKRQYKYHYSTEISLRIKLYALVPHYDTTGSLKKLSW